MYAAILTAWSLFATHGSIESLAALTMPEWMLRYASWILWGLTLPFVGNGAAHQVASANGTDTAATDAAKSDHAARLIAELDGADALTAREHEVTRLLLAGLTLRETAERLDISPSTVATYRSRACEKLGITSLDELAPVDCVPVDTARDTRPSPLMCRTFDLGSHAAPALAVAALCLALLARGLLTAPRTGLPILTLAIAAPVVAAFIIRTRVPRAFAVRLAARMRVVLAGALVCGLLVGGAPGFANFGIGLMNHAQYVSGYFIALMVYLVACALTLALLIREAALDAVAATDPAALDDERCLMYLRGRGAGELQAQALLRIARGETSAYIADALHIARGTVNAHRARGYDLLHVHSAHELATLLARDTGVHPQSQDSTH